MDLGKWLRDRKDQAVRQWQNSVVLDAVSSGTQADNARRQVVADKERALDVGRSQAVKFQGQQFREGKIGQDELLNNINSVVGFGTLEDQGLRKQGDLYFNTKKDNNVNTFLNNAGSAIMNAAPQRVIGGAAEYGGTLIGNEGIRDFGQKISQPYRDFGAAAQENAGNKVLATGSQVAGNLLTLPLNPAGKVGMATRFATAALPRAADTAYAIRQGGGSENAQRIGGGAVGTVSGIMNTLGGEKILKPFTGAASKAANPLTKLLTTKLAPSAAGRVLAAGNMEGLEEVTETGVENLVAQKTFDPNRKLTDNLAQSYVLGAGLGGAVRGSVELGSRTPSVAQLTPELQTKRNDLANGFTQAQQAGRPDLAENLARQIDQIDNPQPGTLREQIRSAKERIIPKGEDGYVKNPFYKEPKTQTLRDYYDRSVGMKKGDKQFTATEAKKLLSDLNANKNGVPQEITQGGYKDLTPQQIAYALNNPATSQGKAIRTFLDQKIDRGNELYKHLDNLQEKLDGLEENPGPNYKKDVDNLIDQIDNIKDMNKDPYVIEFKKYVQDNKELLDSGDLRAINEAADLRDNAENSRFNIDEENVVDLPESRFLDEIGENTRTYGLDELAKDTQTFAPNQADLLSYKPKTTDKVEQLRQQNAIPNENLQRIDALNNTMVAASEVKQKLKQPNDLQEKGVNETVARNRLRNKLMAEKMDVEAAPVGKTVQQGTELFTNFNGKKGTVVGEQDGYILVKPEFGTSTELYTKEQFDRIVSKQKDFEIDARKTEVRQAESIKEEQAKQQETEAVKQRREALLDYSGTNPMQRGRIDKMLSKKVSVWGQEGTLDEVIAAHNPTNKYKVGGEYVIDATDGVNSGIMKLPKTVWDRLKVPEMNRNAFGEKTLVKSASTQTPPVTRESAILPRVGDTPLPIKQDVVIGDTTPLKKGNTRPDPLTTVSGRKIQLDQYNPNAKSAASDSRTNTKWNQTLIKAAIEEAKLRNDSMNLGIFEDMQGTSYKNLSESDMSGIHQYLFDSPDSIKLTYTQSQPPKSPQVGKTPAIIDNVKLPSGYHTVADITKELKRQGITQKMLDDTQAIDMGTFDNSGKVETGSVLYFLKENSKPTEMLAPQAPKTVAPVESKTETPLAKSERLHQEKLTKNNLTQNEYAGLHDKVKELDSKASELHRKVSDATQKAVEQANGQPLTPKVRRQLKAMADEWGKALDDHVDALNVVRKIDGEKPIATSRTKKPFTPISQPVDNLPAVVRQVTKKTKPRKDIEQAGLDQETLTAKQYAETFGVTEAKAKQQLEQPEPVFNASATSKKNSKVLTDALKTDSKITKAVKTAQESGKELNFYAKKDANGRSVGIEQFDPKTNRIEAGFVVDSKGNVLGNHIKVDETGVQVNVGGDLVNMESIIGNPLEWGSTSKRTGVKKGKYKLSETMSRNIDNNAPTPEIANTTKRFLWSSKVKAEANMRTELDAEFTALGDRIKRTNKARPFGVSKEQYKDDIFATLNGDKTDAQIKKEYNPKAAQAILTYKKETRTLYDSLLKRINTERVKFGQEPITPRKDYITHLQEMNQNKGFVTEVYGQMKNSFADEGMGKTRNGVPGDIAGRTENFKPISKYNPFLQQRTGTKSLRDPFMAVQEYLQPAMYNIHMTEPGARARAVESAFRTAEQLKAMDTRGVAKEMEATLEKYKNASSDNSKLITGFQEYANAVAGKTQRFDRQVTDSSDAAAKGLKGWQGLQRIGGRGTILGNLSSVLAQPLNQVVGLADAGGINYAKGIAEYMGGDSQIDKSDFIRARETEATKPLRGTGEKVLDAGSVPLQAVELASVKLMWHTQHQKALSDGYKGQEAIQQADMNTERLVAGRGIADKPELYRSTLANGIYQYTLEVNAQNKAFWQDLDTKQKVKFMVAASATNALMGAITGFEPLPDFLKAIFETGKDFIDPEDDRNVARKIGGGIQRMGDEYAGMNPLISGVANILPQDVRKTVFGQESQLGRYAGGSAPVQVIKNTASAAKNIAQGKPKEAAYDAVRNLPFGNQIRKTVSGAELLAKGQATDSSGKTTFEAPTSIAGKAQVLAFGPNASKNAQAYYDKSGDTKTESKLTKDSKGNTTSDDDFDSIKQAAFNSPEGKKFLELKNDDERKAYANESADNRAMYNQYKSMQKAFNGGDKLLATGLDENSSKILQRYDRMETKAKERVFNNNPGAEYEYEMADYNNKKAGGELGMVDEINYQQRLNKMKATKDFEKGYRDIYSGLSKTEIFNLITTNPQGQAIADKMLAIDDALVAAGEKSKFRDKYGNIKFDPNAKYARGGKGSRGGKTAKDETIAFSNALQSSTLKRLNSLLAGTSKPVTGSKKVATSKPTLKKITVKA